MSAIVIGSSAKSATISALEVARIEQAISALEKDHHAPREITVSVTLHVHHEYPKHVAGKIVNSAAEEAALEA